MKEQIWLIYLTLLIHSVVVGVTIAGCIALLTGRFTKFHKKDYFAWLFMIFTIGQMISLVFTGGCFLTDIEKKIRLQVDPTSTYSKTFLQEYLPFLPDGFIDAIPFITIGGLIGAIIQIRFALRRKKDNDNNK
jgi:ABC-type arginine/histidine transport system permease subunit